MDQQQQWDQELLQERLKAIRKTGKLLKEARNALREAKAIYEECRRHVLRLEMQLECQADDEKFSSPLFDWATAQAGDEAKLDAQPVVVPDVEPKKHEPEVVAGPPPRPRRGKGPAR